MDGIEDVVFGGAKGQTLKIFLQNKNKSFIQSVTKTFLNDTTAEIVDALLFDADKDNDLDLYLVTGGTEFAVNDAALADRLFKNDGKGNFTLTTDFQIF